MRVITRHTRDIFKLLCRIIVDAYNFVYIYFLARVFGNFCFIKCYLPLFPFNLFRLNLELEPTVRRELFLILGEFEEFSTVMQTLD